MTTEEYNKRIKKAVLQHEELLTKCLLISEDLQDKEAIERHKKNILKVKGMMK